MLESGDFVRRSTFSLQEKGKILITTEKLKIHPLKSSKTPLERTGSFLNILCYGLNFEVLINF